MAETNLIEYKRELSDGLERAGLTIMAGKNHVKQKGNISNTMSMKLNHIVTLVVLN